MIYNALPKWLYFIILSLNPPGKLYDVDNGPSFEQYCVFKDIDFTSKVGYYLFNPQVEEFKNVYPSTSTHLIIDIKSIEVNKKGIPDVQDYAWTIIPCYDVIEGEDDQSDQNIYNISGSYMMPLMAGPIDPQLVKKLQTEQDPWAKLNSLLSSDDSIIWELISPGILVRICDNQW